MMKRTYILFLLSAIVLFSSCTKQVQLSNEYSQDILLNQIGYESNAEKKALSRIESETFQLVDADGKIVFEGKAQEAKYWDLSGDTVRVLDFTAFSKVGKYQIWVNGNQFSYPFEIGNGLFTNVANAALKSYYYARCGEDITEEFGGKWKRKAGHPDTEVMIHESAADKNRPAGTILSSPGGWYDAGDYGKYIVNSSITTWTILQSLAINTEFHESQHLNIPESGNNLPDILDEALVNLKWMMTMQDPADGGLYHKLTTKAFDGFIMPKATNKQRYLMQKSTSAALDYASTMAAASRIIRAYELNTLANEMKESAVAAWSWAIENPDVFYIQPDDISTGAYGDTCFVDEWFWAASEMYLITGDAAIKTKMMENYQKPITPKWDLVNTLGVISVLSSERRGEFAEIENDYLAYVDEMLEKEKASPYIISMDKFAWGSNSDVANDGMLKLIAHTLSGDDKYVASARNDRDYILGRNATSYSFVTGFGHLTPMVPHNRIMSADGVEQPIPGYIVGGPNTIVLTDCVAQKVVRSKFPAASYTDSECSYSTNETAINWNAPLVFLLSGLN